jgi:hypothetical protein
LVLLLLLLLLLLRLQLALQVLTCWLLPMCLCTLGSYCTCSRQQQLWQLKGARMA